MQLFESNQMIMSFSCTVLMFCYMIVLFLQNKLTRHSFLIYVLRINWDDPSGENLQNSLENHMAIIFVFIKSFDLLFKFLFQSQHSSCNLILPVRLSYTLKELFISSKFLNVALLLISLSQNIINDCSICGPVFFHSE